VFKNHKVLLIVIAGILALVLAGFLFFMSIRSEFINHLSKEYPGQRFAVGFIKFDPLYGNYFADVTSLDDSIPFQVSKNSHTKEIADYYSGVKRAGQYNSKIKAIFNNSDLKSYTRDVSGWGRSTFTTDAVYDEITLSITEGADMVSLVSETISILKENNVSTEIVRLIQEKDKHLYELSLSPADYSLSKSELEAKVEQRK